MRSLSAPLATLRAAVSMHHEYELREQRRAARIAAICAACGGSQRGPYGCACCGRVNGEAVPAWWSARLRRRVVLDTETGLGHVLLPTPLEVTPAQLAACGLDVWNEATYYPVGLGWGKEPPAHAPQAVTLASVVHRDDLMILLREALETDTPYELRIFDADVVVHRVRFVTGINVEKLLVGPVVVRKPEERP